MTLVKTQLVCLNCKKTFEAGKKTAKYCSGKCRDVGMKTCVVCGNEFKGRLRDATDTCSHDCRATRNKWPVKGSQKQCEACGEQFKVREVRYSRTCNRKCAAALRNTEVTAGNQKQKTWQSKLKTWMKHKQRSWKIYLNQCPQCSGYCATQNRRCDRCIKILSPNGLQKTLQAVQEWLKRSGKKCDRCDKVAEWWSSLCGDCAKERDRKAKGRLSSNKKRCREYGGEYVPGIHIDLIIQRDGIKCHYCGVDTTRHKHNHDTQAEMDHVIPLSKGGSHTMVNIVLSCRRCNNKKSDKCITLF